MRIPAFRAARSFKNGAAPGSAYVQPRIGWYFVVIQYVYCGKA